MAEEPKLQKIVIPTIQITGYEISECHGVQVPGKSVNTTLGVDDFKDNPEDYYTVWRITTEAAQKKIYGSIKGQA